jgi:hypothetical protein
VIASQRWRKRIIRTLSVSLGTVVVALLPLPPVLEKENAAAVPCQMQGASPKELEIYERARSVIDLMRAELMQTYADELRDVEFAADQQELAPLLQKVGDSVAAFFRDLPNTVSREQVRRERLRIDGRVEESITQNYNYSASQDKLGNWEEGRTDNSGRDVPPELMSRLSFLTSGFASVSLHFHPKHQFGCRFRYLGRQRSEPFAQVIAFAQKPGVSDIACTFSSHLRPAPAQLLYQGFVWVDPRSYQIVRLWESLLAPRADVFLASANSDVRFGEVRFQSVSQAFWLPQEVVVTLFFYGQLYRNRHRYSEYQVATVAVEEKIAPPVIKKVMF